MTGGRVGGWTGGVVRALLLLLPVYPSTRLPVLSAQTTDSLIASAQRVARAWRAHDFAGLLEGSREVTLRLPGADPSQPLGPGRVTELLRAFVGTSREAQVEVEVARVVDSLRAYVEIRRTYLVRPRAEPRTETVYVGMRRSGQGYAVSEIRVIR